MRSNLHVSTNPVIPRPGSRRLVALLIVLLAVLGLGIAWWMQPSARGKGGGPAGGRAGAAGTQRDLPSGGRLGGRHGRDLPSAADLLGALGGGGQGGLIRVEGRVLDALTRTPVGDVEVVFDAPAGETTATVDADGNYEIDVVAGEYRAFVRGDHVISVGPARYQRLPTAPDPTTAFVPDQQLAPVVDVQAAQRGVDLEVQRSGTVTGRVLDPDGRPIASAVVRAETGGWVPVLGTNVAETGADGRYSLEVPAGFYELSVAHADYAGVAPVPDDPYQRPNVTVFPAMETEQDLTMARGCVITGRAKRTNGQPSGAGALERGFEDTSYPAGPVADDGTFRFTSTVEEEVRLRVWPWKSPPAPYQTFACKPGARFVADFVIPDDPPDLSGTIVDADGNPVPLAFIDIYGLTEGTMNQQERGDDQGAWGVYALPAGDYTVSAHVPGLGVARAQVHVPSQHLTLRLGGTGGIAGTVEGIPDGETFQLEIVGCTADDGSVVMPATTRLVPVRGGSFQVDGLPACTLIASARGPVRTQMLHLDVVAGDVATVDLDLSPPRTKTVRLHVTGPDGSPVAGAQAIVMSMTGGMASSDPVTTDARGEAELQARVGDQLTVFTNMDGTGTATPMMGNAEVSDAPGSTEDVSMQLMSVQMYDP